MNENVDDTARRQLIRLVRENIDTAVLVGQRLEHYCAELLPHYPFTTEFMCSAWEKLDDRVLALMDAMIKRFEQLLTLEQDNLFKAVATLDNDPSSLRAKRDLSDYMEKIGCMPSAARYSDIAILRNRLAHDYSNNAEKQSRLMNDVMVGSRVLLDVVKALQNYIARRMPVWTRESV